jgi:hypothetical protein
MACKTLRNGRFVVLAALVGCVLALPDLAVLAQDGTGQDEQRKELERKLAESKLVIEQLTKESQRLQAELKALQALVEDREKTIVKVQGDLTAAKLEAEAQRIDRERAVARAQAVLELVREKERIINQLLDKQDPGKLQNPKDPKFNNPPEKYVKGTVKAVEKNLVQIDLGEDQGIRKDHTLEVYRLSPEPKYLGRLLVVDVTNKQSVCRLIVPPGTPAPTLMPGDIVASKLKVPE